jgi:hypothetical protein
VIASTRVTRTASIALPMARSHCIEKPFIRIVLSWFEAASFYTCFVCTPSKMEIGMK